MGGVEGIKDTSATTREHDYQNNHAVNRVINPLTKANPVYQHKTELTPFIFKSAEPCVTMRVIGKLSENTVNF